MGLRPQPNRDCEGAITIWPIPTHFSTECQWAFSLPIMMKNLQFRTAANRAATARSANDLANF
jgi:hypothetical protein